MNKKAYIISSSTLIKKINEFKRGGKYFVISDEGLVNDLYIHLDNTNDELIIDELIHRKFYSKNNNLLPNKLSFLDQMLGLVREKIKILKTTYQGIFYINDDFICEKVKVFRETNKFTINSKPKVAVILSGQPRLIDKTLPTLFKWLEGTEYNLFGHSWLTIGGEGTSNKNLDGSKFRNISEEEKTTLVNLMQNHYLKFGDAFNDPKFPLDNTLYNWQGERNLLNIVNANYFDKKSVHAVGWMGWGFSSWTGYDYAFKNFIDIGKQYDIIIRSRWDICYNNEIPFITWFNQIEDFTDKDIIFNNFEEANFVDPCNYAFFNHVGSYVWLKDHIWIGSYNAQYNFMKNFLDWVNVICMENKDIKCNQRQFPFAESFLYNIALKNDIDIKIKHVPCILAKPGNYDISDFNQVVKNSINWYS